MLMVAIPMDHPLANKGTIAAADLRGQNFISPQFDEAEGFSAILGRLGKAENFPISSNSIRRQNRN